MWLSESNSKYKRLSTFLTTSSMWSTCSWSTLTRTGTPIFLSLLVQLPRGSCDGKGEAGGGRTNKEQQHEHNNKNNKKAG